MKQTLVETIIIIIVSVCVGFLVNGFQTKTPVRPQTDKTEQEESFDAGRQLTIEEAVQDFKSQSALFADARSSYDFDAGHIHGAINLPEHEFDEWIGDFLGEIDFNTKIITYCHGPDCFLANDLAEKLFAAGFQHTHYITDGWEKWQKRKMPVQITK
jgi:rhodanese-related sulfurtransferase